MNKAKYRALLINVIANLRSCINIGVSKPVNHLLELCIDRLEETLRKEDEQNDTECDEYNYTN